MNCQQARDHLSALIDGELTEAAVRRVREHLAQCVACQDQQAAVRALRETVRIWQVEDGDIWEDLRREIEQPDLAALLDEVRQLHAELKAVRTEVALLRREITAPSGVPACSRSSVLFPYARPDDTPRQIV